MTIIEKLVRAVVVMLGLAVAAALCWWAWLGWDHEYYTDPTTGYAAGPYRPWQVVGCVLTLLVVAVVAYRRVGPVLVGVSMTSGFGIAVGATWIPADESGLALLGVVYVVVGMTVVATLLPLVDHAVASALVRRCHARA